MDYLKCILLFFSFIIFLYIVGTAILGNDKNTSYRFVIGYIIYSFFIAIVGISVSLLNLSWKLFLVLVLIIDLGLACFSIFRIIIKKMKINLLEYIKENWCLLLVVILIMITSVAYIEFLWGGNCQDNGFYVNKMGTLPYIDSPFRTAPATGITHNNNFSTYLFNSGEMEASVYIYLLNIDVNIYARFFLSSFNYFLLASIICSIFNMIYQNKKWNFDKKVIQYISIIMILFAYEYNYLYSNNILKVYDSWQFSTAMFFGSSIVKTSGILMLILPLINLRDKWPEKFIIFGMTSVVLISKSTIALPLIFLVGASYFLIDSLFERSNFVFSAFLLVVISSILLSLVIKGHDSFQEYITIATNNNLKSKYFIASLIAFVLGFFLNSKEVLKINISMILIGCLIFIEPINNIFETFSMYGFVAFRMLTVYTYTICILGFGYLCIYLFKIIKNKYFITVLSLILAIFLFNGSLEAYESKYGEISKAYNIISSNNKYLVPNSTVELGKKLQKLHDEENKSINILIPEWRKINGYEHALAVLLREYAPNTRVITAIGRYGVSKGSVFSSYTKDEIQIYYSFLGNPNFNTYNAFKKMLDDYPINCIVFYEENYNEYMPSLGFKLYDKIIDKKNKVSYYIYYNENVNPDVEVDENYGNDTYNDNFENRTVTIDKKTKIIDMPSEVDKKEEEDPIEKSNDKDFSDNEVNSDEKSPPENIDRPDASQDDSMNNDSEQGGNNQEITDDNKQNENSDKINNDKQTNENSDKINNDKQTNANKDNIASGG